MVKLITIMDKMIKIRDVYLPVTERDLSWGMSIYACGHYKLLQGAHYPLLLSQRPRNLPVYQLLYITKGSGILDLPGNPPAELNAGDLLFLLPHARHRYGCGSKGWEEYWVQFAGPQVQTIVENYLQEIESPFTIGVIKDITQHFEKIIRITDRREAAYQCHASAQFSKLLAEIVSLKGIPKEAANKSVAQKAAAFLESNWREDVNLQILAENLGVSYPTLRRIFHQYAGQGLHQYQLCIRLAKARQLLDCGQYSVKEVASKVGFSDQYYFSRLFRKQFSVPPSHAR